ESVAPAQALAESRAVDRILKSKKLLGFGIAILQIEIRVEAVSPTKVIVDAHPHVIRVRRERADGLIVLYGARLVRCRDERKQAEGCGIQAIQRDAVAWKWRPISRVENADRL